MVFRRAARQVSRHLAEQAAEVEAAANLALDALTRAVAARTLERVRRVKNQLSRLKTRVETARPLTAFDGAVVPFPTGEIAP